MEQQLHIANTLIKAATAVIDSLPVSKQHSVAAAAMTADGQIFTGVNVYHFAANACAEIIALGAAAAAGAEGLTHIVAVGNRGRGVLNPCGRCRQVLLDFYPEMAVVVLPAPMEGEGGVRVVSVRGLLPFAYTLREEREREKTLPGGAQGIGIGSGVGI